MKKLRAVLILLVIALFYCISFALIGCSPQTHTVQYWTAEIQESGYGIALFYEPYEMQVEEGRGFFYTPPTISYKYPEGVNTYYAYFQGWYLDTKFTIEFLPSNGIQTDTILYAKYDWGTFRKK